MAKTTYEENIAQLEAIVTQLEGQKLTLEEQVLAYEQGMKLVSAIEKLLDETEARVMSLGEETDAEGNNAGEWEGQIK